MLSPHLRPGRPAALWSSLAACALLAGPPARGDVILYTASVDASAVGGSAVSVPAENNPHLEPIDPGVSLTPPPPIFLDGVATGPLNGITYGPFGFGGNTGGTTGFVNAGFTVGASGFYQLVWEVANALAPNQPSALAIDNVRLNGNLLYGFESGIPADFTTLGLVSTSGAVANLAPTEGSAFAFLDTTGDAVPIFDTVDGTNGSRLDSPLLTLQAGDTLSLDLAFLTLDGDIFHDYGVAALAVIPEPATLAHVAAAGLLAARRLRRRPGPGA